MPLTPFTTNEQVRAVIGVTDDELADATLALEMYSLGLRYELNSIGEPANDGALAVAFETAAALTEDARTTVQRKLYDAVVLFAPYPIALHLETAVPLFAPKAITDGKASVMRHAESPFKDQFDKARAYYERFRRNLTKAWAGYNSSTSTPAALPNLFRISSPSTDFVTDTDAT